MTWLDDLVEATDEIETPRSYIRWAGMSAISAVTRKNVFFDRSGFWKVYPNLYVMLFGPPGITKSYATNLAKKLVKSVDNIRVIDGQNSIEGILEELATARSSPNGHVNKYAHAFIVANELTNLLIDNPQAFSLLTELYDSIYNEEWPKRLKSGTIKLLDPCITMITATNSAHFKNKIKNVDIEGGFIGRTMVISENKLHRINALIRRRETVFNLDPFIDRLREISIIKGEFKMENEEAYKAFEDWYNTFKTEIQKDETGLFNRMPDNVFKVAMINSLAAKNELILSQADIEIAIETCMSLTTNVRGATAGVGISDISGPMSIFVEGLLNAEDYKMERKKILQRNFQHFDVHVMARIVETLHQAGVIEVLNSGSKCYYRLTNLALEKMGK